MLAEHFQILRELSSFTVWLQCVAAIISSNGWQYCVVQWLAAACAAVFGREETVEECLCLAGCSYLH